MPAFHVYVNRDLVMMLAGTRQMIIFVIPVARFKLVDDAEKIVAYGTGCITIGPSPFQDVLAIWAAIDVIILRLAYSRALLLIDSGKQLFKKIHDQRKNMERCALANSLKSNSR